MADKIFPTWLEEREAFQKYYSQIYPKENFILHDSWGASPDSTVGYWGGLVNQAWDAWVCRAEATRNQISPWRQQAINAQQAAADAIRERDEWKAWAMKAAAISTMTPNAYR